MHAASKGRGGTFGLCVLLSLALRVGARNGLRSSAARDAKPTSLLSSNGTGLGYRQAPVLVPREGASSFKILQLADLHFGEDLGGEWGPEQDRKTLKAVRAVLDEERPDLVVFSGDQITGEGLSKTADRERLLRQLEEPMKERGVPWATVFGNHDAKDGSSVTSFVSSEIQAVPTKEEVDVAWRMAKGTTAKHAVEVVRGPDAGGQSSAGVPAPAAAAPSAQETAAPTAEVAPAAEAAPEPAVAASASPAPAVAAPTQPPAVPPTEPPTEPPAAPEAASESEPVEVAEKPSAAENATDSEATKSPKAAKAPEEAEPVAAEIVPEKKEAADSTRTCAGYQCPAPLKLRPEPGKLKCHPTWGCTEDVCCHTADDTKMAINSEPSKASEDGYMTIFHALRPRAGQDRRRDHAFLHAGRLASASETLTSKEPGSGTRRAGKPGGWRNEYLEHELASSLARTGMEGIFRSEGGGVSNYRLKLFASKGDADADRPSFVLWFLDTGGGGFPEGLHADQLEWLRQESAALEAKYGPLPGALYAHVPLQEYAHVDPGPGSATCKGVSDDRVTSLRGGPRLFPLLRKMHVSWVFAGHNHGNDWCCRVQVASPPPAKGPPALRHPDVQLCYGRHSGYGGYSTPGIHLRGARVFEIRPAMARSFLLGQASDAGGETWVRLEDGSKGPHWSEEA